MFAQSTIDRFWEFVEKKTPIECWEWQGTILNSGYGQFHLNGGGKMAHRISYRIHFGKIPRGKIVCHACDNPPCVNPQHLWVGTHQDNTQDAWDKGRMHELPPTNKLTVEDVRRIRRLYDTGKYNQHELGHMFDVTHENIHYIVRRKSWKHI